MIFPENFSTSIIELILSANLVNSEDPYVVFVEEDNEINMTLSIDIVISIFLYVKL